MFTCESAFDCFDPLIAVDSGACLCFKQMFRGNVFMKCFKCFCFKGMFAKNIPCSANAEVTGSSPQQKCWRWCGHDDDVGGGDGGVHNDDV